jgi:hypothetical protein
VIDSIRGLRELGYGGEVEGEPDGRLLGIRPLDTMAQVRWQEHPIARSEGQGLCRACHEEPRPAGDEDHPLGALLVVPLARRGHLAVGNDALEPAVATAENDVEVLLGELARDACEKIASLDHARLLVSTTGQRRPRVGEDSLPHRRAKCAATPAPADLATSPTGR